MRDLKIMTKEDLLKSNNSVFFSMKDIRSFVKENKNLPDTVPVLLERVEEVEFEAGTYFWTDDDLRDHKIIIEGYEENEEEWINYKTETLNSFANIYGIMILEDDNSIEKIPYQFKQFILGGRKKEITEEQFNKEKQEILKRL